VTFSNLTGVGLALLLLASPAFAQTPAQPSAAPDTQFLVFFRSQPVGREEVVVLKTADGWIVRGTSRLGSPIDITSRTAEVQYDAEWRPKSLLVDSIVRGQDILVKTTFSGGKASNIIEVQGKPQAKEDSVSADAVVLPNTFLGSYAGLARRLQGKVTGDELRAYIAPQAEITVRITAAGPGQIETAFSIPGDESVTIPSLGFNLGGSISRPPAAKGPLPALILIGGSGPTDRDETVAGIPVFGQIARELVNAGFIVVRYDKRGVGQSGGRAESVTIADYAEDARQVLLWLEKRKEVDKERIGVVGHSEGALVALLLAGRERNKVGAISLIAGPSTDGNTVVLEQQKLLLEKMPIDGAQRAERVALQEKINTAVMTGKGWADVPPAARKVADTPWFYSFLTFNPERAMMDTRQPVLIVQGELDTQVLPYHADGLAGLARARKTKAEVAVVKVPGINHLLVPAKTGEVTEYATLGPDAKVSTEVTSAIATFMAKALKD
jgi:pimeloyl-ACP methyl ester carboxylesterase